MALYGYLQKEKIAEFVNKKYKTHRRVPDMIMMKLIIKIIKLLYK